MKDNSNKTYGMIVIDYSNIDEYCDQLYKKVILEYNYDLVIFLAKGSYIIGKTMAEKNNCEFIEIFATRSGSKIKKLLKPFLKLIPQKIAKKLREKELNSNVHEYKSDRAINYDKNIWTHFKNKKKILIVDDSVDTGYSILYTYEAVKNYFDNADIKVASINTFTKSKSVVNVDYCLYEDCLIKGPWSSDSKENKKYVKDYYSWRNTQKEDL